MAGPERIFGNLVNMSGGLHSRIAYLTVSSPVLLLRVLGKTALAYLTFYGRLACVWSSPVLMVLAAVGLL